MGAGRRRGADVNFTVDPEGLETRAVHDLVDFDDATVLEIGCGDGRLTWRYAEEAASVLALDLDEQKIERAMADTPTALQPKVTFQAGDITDMDLPVDAFDVAILAHSL